MYIQQERHYPGVIDSPTFCYRPQCKISYACRPVHAPNNPQLLPLVCCTEPRCSEPQYAALPYGAKFSRVFNFANFQLFAKIFQRKFLTRGVQCARAVCACSEFAKLFQRNLQKLLSAKISTVENFDPRKFSAIRQLLKGAAAHHSELWSAAAE